MKIAGVARNVLIAGMAWRLIARRREALARQRRARRIAPLLITAAAAGVTVAARPRILESVRRLWNAARRQLNGETSNVIRQPQREVETYPPAERNQSLRHQENPASAGSALTSKGRPLAEAEPKPRVKKPRKRVARAERRKKARREPAHGLKGEGEEHSEPGRELGESLKP